MKTRIVEATNGPRNWGKFLLGQFDHEWEYKSLVAEGKHLLREVGIGSPKTMLVLDLQTCEGVLFEPGHGFAAADLNKHAVWVCPLFEPFLTWLYGQPEPFNISALVDLPTARFDWAGYRRPGLGRVEPGLCGAPCPINAAVRCGRPIDHVGEYHEDKTSEILWRRKVDP